MTSLQFVIRSLSHHRRIHGAVALGVMAATAVITGALLVGDSVRGSLRHLVLDRLGRMDHVLVTDRFFRTQLASELAETAEFKSRFASVTSAILLPAGTVEKPGGRIGRAANVLIVGADEGFWSLGDLKLHPKRLPADGEVILNEPLAAELGAAVGDEVVLRLPKATQVPADSPLGRKTDRVENLAGLKVIEIIPSDGLGRFGLRSSQHLPNNAYVSLTLLQEALQQADKCNALLVAGDATESGAQQLTEILRPSFEDFGLNVQRVRRVFHDPAKKQEQTSFDDSEITQLLDSESQATQLLDSESQATHLLLPRMPRDPESAVRSLARNRTIHRASLVGLRSFFVEMTQFYRDGDDDAEDVVFDYFQLTSDRLMLDPSVEETARKALAGERTQLVLTYLANSIELVSEASETDRKPGIPYSTIAAVDSNRELGPVDSEDGTPVAPLADDEIALNSWAANDLGAKPGDTIRIRYFEPETTHGNAVERSAEFKLKAIVPLTEPETGYRRKRPAEFSTRMDVTAPNRLRQSR